MGDERIESFADFWPCYVRAHSRRGTRVLHGIGSLLALGLVAGGMVVNPWLLVLAPVIGYGFAWTSHFFVQRNRPATFGHPFWSLAADYRMLFLMLTGRMGGHVEQATGLSRENAAMMAAEDA